MRYSFTEIQRKIRERGLTLAQVGVLAGIHEATVSRAIKNGRAHQKTAIALAKAFGVSLKSMLPTDGRAA